MYIVSPNALCNTSPYDALHSYAVNDINIRNSVANSIFQSALYIRAHVETLMHLGAPKMTPMGEP